MWLRKEFFGNNDLFAAAFHEMPCLSSSPNSAGNWGNDFIAEKYGKLVERSQHKMIIKSSKSPMRVKVKYRTM